LLLDRPQETQPITKPMANAAATHHTRFAAK
jgi:hypothetical protein